MKYTLVIGNGFDLDAGLKTSYRDFADSDYWPFRHSARVCQFDTLGSYLNERSSLETWFDVEETIYDYAKQGIGNAVYNGFNFGQNNKMEYEELKKALTSYLSNQESTFVQNPQSMGVAVLNALLTSNNEAKIYSFNYTSLQNIVKRFKIDGDVSYEHIHGSIEGNDIILGVGDKREIPPQYFYLNKVAAPNFSSHHIIPDMLESDEIIIFGMSLGSNDYPYFEPFFHNLSSIAKDLKKRKRITIFTRDENGRIEIKKKLQEMTQNQVTLLYSLNDVKILCTDGSMHGIIDDYLGSINEQWFHN